MLHLPLSTTPGWHHHTSQHETHRVTRSPYGNPLPRIGCSAEVSVLAGKRVRDHGTPRAFAVPPLAVAVEPQPLCCPRQQSARYLERKCSRIRLRGAGVETVFQLGSAKDSKQAARQAGCCSSVRVIRSHHGASADMPHHRDSSLYS